MNLLHSMLIICVITMSASPVAALTISRGTNTTVTNARISEARLLETYIIRYNSRIHTLYHNYSDTESIALENADKQLFQLQNILIDIQRWEYSEEEAVIAMKQTVTSLKTLNTRIKIYLEQEQLIYYEQVEKKKQEYHLIGTRISKILDTLIETLSQPLIEKDSLSESEKSIVRSLVNIRTENNKIKKFTTIKFSSIEEIQEYFQEIIQNIRTEMITIKKMSR